MSEKKSIYDRVNERLIDMIEKTNTLPWEKSWSSDEYPTNLHSMKRYHGSNLFYLYLSRMFHGYQHGYWLTYLQAQAMGGIVKHGSVGELVVYYDRVTKDEVQTDPASGEERTVQVSYPVLKYYFVFNIDQITGIELNIEQHDNVKLREPENLIEFYDEMVPVQHGSPAYHPQDDFITMPDIGDFHSSEDYYSTLFHEVIHSTGASHRLNRHKGEFFGDETYSKEELIAEMGASYLCTLTGIENDHLLLDHAAYLKGWLNALKDNQYLFVQAAAKAERAVKFIVEHQADSVQQELLHAI